MFTTTRVKLTIWYLCIIMLISIMFSIGIYRILTNELNREASRISERYSREYGILPPPGGSLIEPQAIEASEQRILFSLIYINVIIFAVSGVGGYILAGFTLKPIREMIDEQNRFITDASHELRTPITSLKSEIEVYLREKHHTTKKTAGLLESNLEEVNNLQILSDSLIELAQYKNSPSVLQRSHISLENILHAAIKKVQKLAKQKNMTITKKNIAGQVYGNKEQFINLFSILLDNAIKYSPKDSTVVLRSEKMDPTMIVIVQDEGTGIEEKDVPHIFDRFYRADSSRTKQDTPGYGLGLSIAKKIVSQHHGEITVDSIFGKGTKFTVQLPIAE